jgi:hypothetical protein
VSFSYMEGEDKQAWMSEMWIRHQLRPR